MVLDLYGENTVVMDTNHRLQTSSGDARKRSVPDSEEAGRILTDTAEATSTRFRFTEMHTKAKARDHPWLGPLISAVVV
jgi:hypothetical protein